MKTHRVSTRYATKLSILRASILSLTEGSERDVLLGQLDDLAGTIAQGFAPLAAMELDRQTTPGDAALLDLIAQMPGAEQQRRAG